MFFPWKKLYLNNQNVTAIMITGKTIVESKLLLKLPMAGPSLTLLM